MKTSTNYFLFLIILVVMLFLTACGDGKVVSRLPFGGGPDLPPECHQRDSNQAYARCAHAVEQLQQ